jgi:hypothetical protein
MQDTASLVVLAPIFKDYAQRHNAMRPYWPGGKPNAADLFGLLKRVASNHGITPQDLQRWLEAHGADLIPEVCNA